MDTEKNLEMTGEETVDLNMESSVESVEEEVSAEKKEKTIETMDDLRNAMNDPDVVAANKAMSKKFLKANRPKSFMLVIAFLAALFLLIDMSSHKVYNVTPPTLRTTGTAMVATGDASSPWTTKELQTLTAEQQNLLVELLGTVKAKHSGTETDFTQAPHIYFYCGNDDPDDWFAFDQNGNLYLDSSTYEITKGDNTDLWIQLHEVCGLTAP